MNWLIKLPFTMLERFWFVRALSTSIGKKYLMGITGLFFSSFLCIHLAGNLLLYVGPDAYNTYAHTLHSQEWFVKSAEALLVVTFAIHIVLAYQTSLENRAARRERYSVKQTKILGRDLSISPETWMLVSGIVILLFLIWHLIDFVFEARTDVVYDGKEPYDKAVAIMQTPSTLVIYLVGCVFLGAHLLHGFQSAFQSLGLNHPKYDKFIKTVGVIFAIVMLVAFGMFPLWAKAQ